MNDKVEQHYDLFKGDSGGPLNCFNPETNHWELCGIVSFGYRCGTGKSSMKCVYLLAILLKILSSILG